MFQKTIPILAFVSSAQAHRVRSIPACDTYKGCKTDTAAGLDYSDVVTQHSSFQDSQRVNRVIDNYVPDAAGLHAQVRSIPACNTYDGCKTGSAAKPWASTAPTTPTWGLKNHDWQDDESSGTDIYSLHQSRSNPACTSFGCKTESYSPNTLENQSFYPNSAYVRDTHAQTDNQWLSQQRSDPACTSFGCKTESYSPNTLDNQSFYPNSAYVRDTHAQTDDQWLSQQRSNPACTSLGCKTGSVVHPYTDTIPFESATWGKNNQHWQPDDQWLSQQRSIPACNTYDGCKTGSAAKPWATTAPTTPTWGLKNHDWQDDESSGTDIYSLIQLGSESRPACTSVECKTGTAAFDFSPPDKKIKDYDVPNFGEDKEISAAKQHIAEAEAKLGKWDIKGYTKPDHDINYKVPNFGMDVDMIDSIASEASTSAALDHKWEVKLDN